MDLLLSVPWRTVGSYAALFLLLAFLIGAEVQGARQARRFEEQRGREAREIAARVRGGK